MNWSTGSLSMRKAPHAVTVSETKTIFEAEMVILFAVLRTVM